jgi:hypothetical protein
MGIWMTMPLKSTSAAAALLLFCWPALACRPQEGPSRGDAPNTPAQAAQAVKSPARDGQDRQAPTDPFESVPRIEVEEAAEAVREGRAVLVDVRPAEAFAEERIRGAVSLPEEDVAERFGELPKGKLIVVYCA